MTIRMLYFAWVREGVGRGDETVDPPADVMTIADLLDWLSADSGAHAAAFAERDRLRAAADQSFVPLDHRIAGVREIAIFPPVTGG